MLGPNQKKWIAALRSGEYQQCTGRLKKGGPSLRFEERRGFCCLGVWLDICDVEWEDTDYDWYSYNDASSNLPDLDYKELGLKSDDGLIEPPIKYNNHTYEYLTDCNDHGLTFEQIADFCEKYPESIFKEEK